jgi:DNA polymerase/3'-5' exonuclease PolX
VSNFPRETAAWSAGILCQRLQDYCERIEIAGSIRRKRPRVNDIDIVAIPKMQGVEDPTPQAGLFEVPRGSSESDRVGGRTLCAPRDTIFARALCERLSPIRTLGDKIISGNLCMPGHEAFPVDVFLATPETWATLLLIRTGSKEHNIQMCQQARSLGMKLHANGDGLTLANGVTAIASSEEEIFAALKMTWKPPEAR